VSIVDAPVVEAQPVLARRGREDLADLRVLAVGRDQRRREREHDEDDEDQRADQGHRARAQDIEQHASASRRETDPFDLRRGDMLAHSTILGSRRK